MPDLKHVLAKSLALAPVADIPEISMFTAGPSSGLRHILEARKVTTPPYWAHHWAGGLVLARYVLDHPEIVRNRWVLDVGSGGGLVAIAAALAGACHVTSADMDPLAAVAVALNAEANGVTVLPQTGDACVGDWPDVQTVLAGDVFYDEMPARSFTRFAHLMIARDIPVFVGDPWRAHLPVSHLRLLAQTQVHDFGGGSKRVEAGVFQFQPSKTAKISE